MIWLFRIDEVFGANKPKVNQHYLFGTNDVDFDITLYDISLYFGTSNYFLLNDANSDEIYKMLLVDIKTLQYSGLLNNPNLWRPHAGRFGRTNLLDKNTDYYKAVRDFYIIQSRNNKIEIAINDTSSNNS